MTNYSRLKEKRKIEKEKKKELNCHCFKNQYVNFLSTLNNYNKDKFLFDFGFWHCIF